MSRAAFGEVQAEIDPEAPFEGFGILSAHFLDDTLIGVTCQPSGWLHPGLDLYEDRETARMRVRGLERIDDDLFTFVDDQERTLIRLDERVLFTLSLCRNCDGALPDPGPEAFRRAFDRAYAAVSERL